MQPPIVLTAEPHPTIHDLALADCPELDRHLGADRAAIAARADEFEPNPMCVPGRGSVPIQQWPALFVRDHDIQLPAIEEIGHRDRPPVEEVRDSCRLRNIHELSRAARPCIHQYPRALVAGEAGAADGWPVLRVFEDVALRAGDLRHRIPVIARRVGGDEAVRHDEIEQPVVVQVAELRAPRPPRVGDDAGRDFVKTSELLQEIEPQVVALKQESLLGDIRDEDVVLAAVVHVADRDRHAALGVVLEPGARQLEALALAVQE